MTAVWCRRLGRWGRTGSDGCWVGRLPEEVWEAPSDRSLPVLEIRRAKLPPHAWGSGVTRARMLLGGVILGWGHVPIGEAGAPPVNVVLLVVVVRVVVVVHAGLAWVLEGSALGEGERVPLLRPGGLAAGARLPLAAVAEVAVVVVAVRRRRAVQGVPAVLPLLLRERRVAMVVVAIVTLLPRPMGARCADTVLASAPQHGVRQRYG